MVDGIRAKGSEVLPGGSWKRVVEYILERLPNDEGDWVAVRKANFGLLYCDADVHSGRDIMRAAAVAEKYLLLHQKPLARNALRCG